MLQTMNLSTTRRDEMKDITREVEQVVDQPVLFIERGGEDQRHGHRGDYVGHQHAHAPEGLRPNILVQHRRDEGRDDQLRDGGEQEDAEGVEQRIPE